MNAAAGEVCDEGVPKAVEVRYTSGMVAVGNSCITKVGLDHAGEMILRHSENTMSGFCRLRSCL